MVRDIFVVVVLLLKWKSHVMMCVVELFLETRYVIIFLNFFLFVVVIFNLKTFENWIANEPQLLRDFGWNASLFL